MKMKMKTNDQIIDELIELSKSMNKMAHEAGREIRTKEMTRLKGDILVSQALLSSLKREITIH